MICNIHSRQAGKPFLVGVIAGTHFDTNLGLNLIKNAGIPTVSCCLSETPQEQTLLQLGKDKLQQRTAFVIGKLQEQGASCILIYCNSLNALLNLNTLQQQLTVPIVTPLSLYQETAKNTDRLALIAANGQAVANIERILIKENSNCIVIGLGNLALVNAIEKALDPLDIMSSYKLIQQCHIFEEQGCHKIILACTHLAYIYDQLLEALKKSGCLAEIIEPSKNMLNTVLTLQ